MMPPCLSVMNMERSRVKAKTIALKGKKRAFQVEILE
jgi:hypothetical protein